MAILLACLLLCLPSMVHGETPPIVARQEITRMDRPLRRYRIRLLCHRCDHDLESLRRLGVSFTGGGGSLLRLGREGNAQVQLSDLVGRGKSRSVQTLVVQEGGEATSFFGETIPVLSSQRFGTTVLTQTRSLSAGKRLHLRALRALGADAIELAVSLEDSTLSPTTAGMAVRGARSETILQARLGRPVVLASLDGSSSSTTGGVSFDGGVQVFESRSSSGWPRRRTRIRRSPLRGRLVGGRRRTRADGMLLFVVIPELVPEEQGQDVKGILR